MKKTICIMLRAGMWRRISLTVVLVAVCVALFGREYSPEDMPNPNLADRRAYVSDPGSLMSSGAKRVVNMRLDSLRTGTTVEVAVAVVPDMGDMPIEDFSRELFEKWKVGKSDLDNGALLVIAPEQRRVRIETGYGVEGVLPDIACKRIIEEAVVPSMKDDDLDGAVVGATLMMTRALSDPAVAEELRSSRGNEDDAPIDPDDIWAVVIGLASIFTAVCLGLFVADFVKALRVRNNYMKALQWRKHLSLYWIGAALSVGGALIIALAAQILYLVWRNRSVRCENCGTKMKKLGEEEDNAYLTPSQDLEERLNTVDYDVWKCPKCGTVERFPFKVRQLRYSECPACHTVAMRLKYDKTIQPATTRRPGVGERVYECEYCRHQKRNRYTIPQKEDATAAALGAAAIIGGSRSGGGGGFGGGFGGGSSGGGGASGGW